jgi:hypothetical protein
MCEKRADAEVLVQFDTLADEGEGKPCHTQAMPTKAKSKAKPKAKHTPAKCVSFRQACVNEDSILVVQKQ